MPESWTRAKLDDQFAELLDKTSELYRRALDAGIPAEDARFILPNAAPTNFHVMVNFAEMLHICDLRLCVRAQWEIRRMVALMRAEIKRVLPEIAVFLQPKCGENRMGYCDESLEDWNKCPLGRVRPTSRPYSNCMKSMGVRRRKPSATLNFARSRSASSCRGRLPLGVRGRPTPFFGVERGSYSARLSRRAIYEL